MRYNNVFIVCLTIKESPKYYIVSDVGGRLVELKDAITEIRKSKKRNFVQSIDLVIPLKNIDTKRKQVDSTDILS